MLTVRSSASATPVKYIPRNREDCATSKKWEIIYKNILIYAYLHIAALYGFYLSIVSTSWATIVFTYFTYVSATIGVTAGAHRLWAHRAYKASLPLQIILMIFLSMANQNAIDWVKDHRLHHKFTDTDADPHNTRRGMFFSHIGWVFLKRHSEVTEKGKLVDLSDLYKNPVLEFQRKYNLQLTTTFCFILPLIIPIIFWNETINNSWHIIIMRYVINIHVFFLVNSAAHFFGTKTYDKNISSTEHKAVSIATFGEGFHNYHHVFPSDYKNAELGNNFFNYTKLFIEICAWIGWAYDLKTVPDDVILRRILRTGKS